MTSKKIMVYLPAEEYKELKEFCFAWKISMSQFSRNAIKEKIQKEKYPHLVKKTTKSTTSTEKQLLTKFKEFSGKIESLESNQVLMQTAMKNIVDHGIPAFEIPKKVKIGVPRKKLIKGDIIDVK